MDDYKVSQGRMLISQLMALENDTAEATTLHETAQEISSEQVLTIIEIALSVVAKLLKLFGKG